MCKKPKTFLVGFTALSGDGLKAYLEHTDQMEFWDEIETAVMREGISGGEVLCSFYAKLCYKSLVEGKNANITKTRGIPDNFRGVMDSGHGAVFEHCWMNFVTTDCSRVFTHELVRHRVGVAYSQTSGRYCAIDQDLDIVVPPELEPYTDYLAAVKQTIIDAAAYLRSELIDRPGVTDFATKKKITSAIRRIAPNGQTNEIGWSCNIRSLRHMIEMRTSRHAEWEIRHVFNEVADLVQCRFPLMLCGGQRVEVDGLYEYTGLRV